MLSRSINKYQTPQLEKLNNNNNQNKEDFKKNSTIKRKTEPKLKNLSDLYNEIPKPLSSKNVNKKKIDLKRNINEIVKNNNNYKQNIKSAKVSPLPLQNKRDVSPVPLSLNNNNNNNNSHTLQKKNSSNNIKKIVTNPPHNQNNNMNNNMNNINNMQNNMNNNEKPSDKLISYKKGSLLKNKVLVINNLLHPERNTPNFKQSLTPTGLSNVKTKTLFSSIKDKKPDNNKTNDISATHKGKNNNKLALTPERIHKVDIHRNYTNAYDKQNATMPKKPSSGVPSSNSSHTPNQPSGNSLTINKRNNANQIQNQIIPVPNQNLNNYKQANVNTTKARSNNKSISGKNDQNQINLVNNQYMDKEIESSSPTSILYKDFSSLEEKNEYFRETMEDCTLISEKFSNNMALFTLYDGHGGDNIAKFARDKLPLFLNKALSKIKDIEDAINVCFKQLDNEIKSLNLDKVGTTASIILLHKENNTKEKIYCANVGDSRTVIISGDNVIKLSYDHKGTDSHEAERVKKAGGVIFGGRVYGKFALTRALGDFELKKNGVISTPFISKKDLDDKDRYIVVASDGVWDVINDELLLELSFKARNSDELCKSIVKTSLEKFTQDNVSCIVIRLK